MNVRTFDTNTQEGRDGVMSLLGRLSVGAAPIEPERRGETMEGAFDRIDREWAAARANRGVK